VDGYPGDLPVAEPILTRELGGVLELLWPVASPDEQLDCLGAALASAHGALCRACKDQGVRFTSVTVAALLICGDQAHLAHVGDGRIYRFRAGRLEPLTSDHNVSDLLFARLPVGDNFMNDLHYGFNNPTIGKDFDALIEDRKTVAIEPGDRFLLCTSYLFIVIEPDQAEAILTAHADDAAAMQALVEAARVACDQDLPTPRVVLITARAGQRAP
jgi:serine/threonine protein phosphatase PrpC